MKQTLTLVFTFIVIHLSGCNIDKITVLRAYLINNSSVSVLVLPYKSGAVMSSDTIKLEPGEKLQIGDGWEFGEIKIPHFFSEFLAIQREDSIKVVFDYHYPVLHYIDTPEIITVEKYYSFDMSRNIINRDNYHFEMVRDKSGRINNHYYYFTEDDYDFAKE